MEKLEEIAKRINSLSIVAIKGILKMDFEENTKFILIESVLKDRNILLELTDIKIKL